MLFELRSERVNPFTPKFKRYILPTRNVQVSEVVRIGSIIIFHLSKLWIAKFFILCDVIFLVRLAGEIWEWKGNRMGMSFKSGHIMSFLSHRIIGNNWQWAILGLSSYSFSFSGWPVMVVGPKMIISILYVCWTSTLSICPTDTVSILTECCEKCPTRLAPSW